MAQGINGGLVPAYATLAANIFAVSAAFQFLKDAGNLVALQRGQEAYAASTGVALRSIANDIIAATDAQIGFQEASQAAAIGTASGLGTDQLNALAEGAKNVSIILGRDVTDSFNRLIRGVTKAEPELLDELGIILRLDRATSNYAQTINKSAKEFTEFERSQAVAVEVITQLEDKYNRIAAATELSVNKFNQLGKAFDDITNKIKEFSATALAPLAEAIVESPTLGIALMGLFAKGVITAALPAIGSFAFASNEALENARVKAAAATKAMQELGNTTDRAAGAAAAASRAQAAAANAPLQGKAIGKLAQGRGAELSSRQISGLLTQVKRSEKLKRDEFKKTKQVLVTELEIMLAATRRTNKDMTRVYQTSASLAQRAWTTAVAGIRTAMAALATAANFAATALSRIFAFAGYASLAIALIEIVRGYLGFKKAAEETTDELALQQKQLELSTRKIEELNQQFADFVAVQSILTEDGAGTLQFFTALGNQVTALNSGLFKIAAGNALDQFSEISKEASTELANRTARIRNLREEIERTKDLGLPNLPRLEASLASELSATVGLGQSFLDFLLTSSDRDLKAFGTRIDGLQQSFELLNERFGRGPEQLAKFGDALSTLSDPTATIDEQIAAVNTIQESYRGTLDVVGKLNNLQRISNENQRQFTSVLQTLGKETTEATLLRTQRQELEALKSEELALSDAKKDRIAQLEQEIGFVQAVVDLEANRARAEARLAITREVSLRNRTNLVRAEQEDRLKIIELRNQEEYLSEKIRLLEFQKANNAETFSRAQEDNLDLLRRQLLLLQEQQETIRNNRDLMQQFANAANQSFETGLQRGLSAIFKAQESSLKDAVLGIAKSMIESVADVAARNLTEMITRNFTGVTAAQTIASAMIAAGRQVAITISSAIASAGLSSSVAPVVSSAASFVRGAVPGGGASAAATKTILGLKNAGITTPGQYFTAAMSGKLGYFANGGIMKGGFQSYANGGIVSQPTIGLVGEGRFNEAVVPLPNGKAIPVDMKGAGGVTVNVSVNNNGSATTSVEGTQQQSANFGKAIAMAVQKEIQNQKRSGGMLNPYGVA